MNIKVGDGIKTVLIIGAVFFLCGSSFPEKSKLIQAKIAAEIQIPKWYHEGLYFDGKNVWVNNGEGGKTWVVDTSSGSVIKEIEPVGTFTESITLKSDNLFFVTDWNSEKIYTIRIEKGRMIAQSEVCVSPAHPAGAIWNGSNLFVITWTRGLYGTKFHIIKMDDKFNIATKKRINRIQEPAHLAWDGKNLWISSWYDRRVYKIEPENFEIMGYFKSPVERTTGIAWDGRYLWLTGTNANLYRIEIAMTKKNQEGK
ncbi:MAG: hypothetical protein A3G36_05625 [Omnitrophica bacterium RIFCSPLOWO2_12_FULL_45_13]|nr:MAG: hypothetical protein A3G36_05625 [Omnitrophica bacterium RIFCSPLOWO2_12_FULL_45_13]